MELNKDEFYKVYTEAPSLRYAAKKLGVCIEKLRLIRDLEGWPKKVRIPQIKIRPKKPARPRRKPVHPRMSLYDCIETSGGLTKEQIERICA